VEGKIIIAISVLVLIGIVVLIIFTINSFLVDYKNSDSFTTIGSPKLVLEKLDLLAAGSDIRAIVEVEECEDMSKSAEKWAISGCTEDIIIYVITDTGGRPVMQVCGNWVDGKDVAENGAIALNSFGFDVSCDKDSIVLVEERPGEKIYDICGSNVYMRGGCII